MTGEGRLSFSLSASSPSHTESGFRVVSEKVESEWCMAVWPAASLLEKMSEESWEYLRACGDFIEIRGRWRMGGKVLVYGWWGQNPCNEKRLWVGLTSTPLIGERKLESKCDRGGQIGKWENDLSDQLMLPRAFHYPRPSRPFLSP